MKAPEYSSTPRVLAPVGTHVARCIGMDFIGTIPKTFQDGTKKDIPTIRITWELPNELHVFKEGEAAKPFVVTEKYSYYTTSTANLRQMLESWRGKGFTDEEAKDFDTDNLLGVPCTLSIVHKTSKAGKDRAEVSSVAPMMKGIECPPQVNPSTKFDVREWNQEMFDKFPQFLKDDIKTSAEYIAMVATAAPAAPAPVAPAPAQPAATQPATQTAPEIPVTTGVRDPAQWTQLVQHATALSTKEGVEWFRTAVGQYGLTEAEQAELNKNFMPF